MRIEVEQLGLKAMKGKKAKDMSDEELEGGLRDGFGSDED